MTNDTGKVGTLAELGVKAGDVVECVSSNLVEDIGVKGEIRGDGIAKIKHGVGIFNPNYDKVLNRTYRIISRASEEPKTWGQMTDEEKGALLLAKHDGVMIVSSRDGVHWVADYGCRFTSCNSYRIKPEPVVDTVVMYTGPATGPWGWTADNNPLCRTHRITFETKDGEPDVTTIAIEKL